MRLGPDQATAADYWRGLFALTYGTELRPESGSRGLAIHQEAAEWFDRGLPLALVAHGLPAEADARGVLTPALPRPRARRWRAERWQAGWAVRRVLGKALNIARLVKAAFTFEGGADYLAWKIERHSGEALALSEWQRRHPILAAPALLRRLRRRGAVR